MIPRRTHGLSESWGTVEQEDTNISDFEGAPEEPTPKATTRKAKARAQDHLASSATQALPTTPRRRVTRSSTAEPQFVMPSPETYPDLPSSSRGLDASARNSQRLSSRRTSTRGSNDDPTLASSQESVASPIRSKQAPWTRDQPAFSWLDSVLYPVLRYNGGVLVGALQWLQPLISAAVALLIISLLISFIWGFIVSATNAAISPICSIPGSSLLIPSLCSNKPPSNYRGPVEFDKLMTAQSVFEDVLLSTKDTIYLPDDMKTSEAAIRDVRNLVRHSALPSRAELLGEMNNFVEGAKLASFGLTKFNNRIGSAVDDILRVNNRTLTRIAQISSSQPSTINFLTRLYNAVTVPLPDTPRQQLVHQYISHTEVIESKVAKLILEAHTLLGVLDNLDENMDAIHSIATRDGIATAEEHEAILANLFTMLGANREYVSRLERQREILANVAAYRRDARFHVHSTILKLQGVAASIEDLRERLAQPAEGLGTAQAEDGVTVHLENIEASLSRLQELRRDQQQLGAERVMRNLDMEGVGTAEVPRNRLVDATRNVRPVMPQTAG